jgi:uncharacterized protein YcfJ
MRNRLLTAILAGATAIALTAPVADAATHRHRVKVCDRAPHSRSHNNTGTAIGAVAGGLLGHSLASGGGKTGGTIIGAGAGAVAGHEIAKHSGRHCHWEYR